MFSYEIDNTSDFLIILYADGTHQLHIERPEEFFGDIGEQYNNFINNSEFIFDDSISGIFVADGKLQIYSANYSFNINMTHEIFFALEMMLRELMLIMNDY